MSRRPRPGPRVVLVLVLALALGTHASAAPPNPAPWGTFVETNFPCFSSVLDARHLPRAPSAAADNLTPRGIILNLGQDCWACFDLDLLRISAIWTGRGVTPVSMSQGSYQANVAGAKAPEGQRTLPQPYGQPWLVNGLYPGWQSVESASQFARSDPRPPGPDPKEIGRGPLPANLGGFRSLQILGNAVELHYEIFGCKVTERVTARTIDGRRIIQREFALDSVPRSLGVALGYVMPPAAGQTPLEIALSTHPLIERHSQPDGLHLVRVLPSTNPIAFRASIGVGSAPPLREDSNLTTAPPRRWTEAVVTRAVLAKPGVASAACVLDDIPLPTDNPWRRNVRLADIAFDPGGRAAAVTFDGDVWIIDGLRDELDIVSWRRFSSGFHEPLGIAFRDRELFVNDRNGIWRLLDSDQNGEADQHELFSNAFTQTAETREFATGLRVAPDGAFILSKGGQQTSTIGRDNGCVLRIAPDGKSSTTLGWGLRMPFIGVHPETGLVTASDQQGNYVPATPLHLIRDHQFYGFISLLLPKERYPAPIAPPVTWIPHPVNASGASQVWLTNARMGPLNDALIHLGYYRPELFLVRWNERARQPRASVMSLTRDLRFAPLNGAVNPADGRLYVTGFQIWGTVAKEISGLARVRHTSQLSLFPREITAMTQGILARFDVPLAPALATNPASYSIERWNYRRTASYGSPHLRLDGTPGQETLGPSSIHLSRDGRAVFIAVADMRPVMQMRLGWSLAMPDGPPFASSAYFTPHDLLPLNAPDDGFAPLSIDLTRRPVVIAASPQVPATADEGRRVAELMGCVACHSDDGTTLGKVGPTWKGLIGRPRDIIGHGEVIADEAYLRESILDPPAKVPRGFDKGDIGMPSYQGVLTAAQVDALVAYLKSLQ